MYYASAKSIRVVPKMKKRDCKFVGDDLVCDGLVCKLEKRGLVCEKRVEEKNIDEWSKSDVFLGHLYLVVIAAILSFTFTQVIKAFMSKKFKDNVKNAIVRLFAVFTGGFVAYTLSDPFQMIDVYLGASAGALNAFVIKMFKLKVKKSLGVEESDG